MVAIYHKRRLAPFGEYVPLWPVLGPLTGHTEAADVDRATGARLPLLAGGVVAGFGLTATVRALAGRTPATRPCPVSPGPARPPRR